MGQMQCGTGCCDRGIDHQQDNVESGDLAVRTNGIMKPKGTQPKFEVDQFIAQTGGNTTCSFNRGH